jgi:hypothetical protein
MDAKTLYFDAVKHFLTRNRAVLPQVQLQTGANERWFARELCICMNTSLTGTWRPAAFDAYADAEVRHADISVHEPGRRRATLLYEVKVLYSTQRPKVPVIQQANRQLRKSKLSADKKLGLFVLIYCSKKEATRVEHERTARAFRTQMARLVRKKFHSDHRVRATELAALRRIDYTATGNGLWWTQSWIAWGAVGPTRRAR